VGADLVLLVARLGAPWPQIAWPGALALTAIGLVASRPKARPFLAVAGGLLVTHLLLGGSADLIPPAAVVLDVGQGDAILVVSGEGSAMLVDGGPDPALLERKLASYGVTRLDLVVLTHVHADHATGLSAVLGRRPVGVVWLPEPPHTTPASRRIADTVEALGIPSTTAPVGEVLTWDDLLIEVLGPVRRYASPNDQSVVVRITGPGGRRLLLTGDIEVHAQRDLAGVEADVLKVPHQGGATSDLDWLVEVGAEQAVISVGPNDFGHPAPGVVGALAEAGAEVTRTDEVGDVVIDLGSRR
jgi:competence protein ComEC